MNNRLSSVGHTNPAGSTSQAGCSSQAAPASQGDTASQADTANPTGSTSQAMLETPRPMLPWLLGPLAMLWLGVYLTEQLTWRGYYIDIRVLMVAGFGLALAAGAIPHGQPGLGRTRLFIPTLVLACSLVGAAMLGALYWQPLDGLGQSLAQDPPSRLAGRVVSDPSVGRSATTSIIECRLPDGQAFRCRVFWPDRRQVPPYGAEVVLRGRYRPLTEYQEFLFSQAVLGSFVTDRLESEAFPPGLFGQVARFRAANRELLLAGGEESGLLLTGILLGDASGLNASWTGEAFRITGLSHLVAVSGSHLAVIAALIGWMLRQAKLKTAWEVGVLLLFVGLYVVLTAMAPSALRSAGMIGIYQGSRLVGRRSHAPSALSVTACIMVIARPETAFSIGFWLSVFAVFSLAVFWPLVKAWMLYPVEHGLLGRTGASPKSKLPSLFSPSASAGLTAQDRLANRRRRWLKAKVIEPASLCLTAQAGTLPLTAPVFANIPLIGLPANLVATPLVTAILAIGLPTMVFASPFPPVQGLLLRLLHAISWLACELACGLARLPWASLPVDFGLGAFMVVALLLAATAYWLWPLPNQASWTRAVGCALAVLLVLAAWAAGPKPPELVMLDVGQGDAILVREGRACVLIDTGPDPTSLRRALARNQVSGLDALVLSHLDHDHAGAVTALVGTVKPDQAYVALGLLASQSGNRAIEGISLIIGEDAVGELKAQDILVVSEHLRVTVLLPIGPVGEGDNDDSLVLSLEYDADADGLAEQRVLLTGDAEADVLQLVCLNYPGLDFGIVKVPHHGSKDSITAELLAVWSTEVALVSVGARNSYGHPSVEALSELAGADCLVLRTDELGDIRVRFGADGITIGYSGLYPLWSH